MKSLKKRLENELDRVVPSLNDEVLNAPIVCEREEKPTPFFSKNKIIASVTAFVLTLCCIIASIPLFSQNNSSVILVEINPKVTFSVNEKGLVTSVAGANADADIILASEQKGKINYRYFS